MQIIIKFLNQTKSPTVTKNM